MAVKHIMGFVLFIIFLPFCAFSTALDDESSWRYFKLFKIFNPNEENYIKKFHFEMAKPSIKRYYKVLFKDDLPVEAEYFNGKYKARRYVFDKKGRVKLSIFNNSDKICKIDYSDKLIIKKCKIDDKVISSSVKKYDDLDLLIELRIIDKKLNINKKFKYDHFNNILHSYDFNRGKVKYSSSKEDLKVFSRYNVNRSYLDDISDIK